jgi:hypothetical protein
MMQVLEECEACRLTTSGRCPMHTPQVTVTIPTTIIGPAITLTPFPSVPQGWQCPLCRNVFAPHVSSCGCANTVSVYGVTTSGG